MDYITHYQSPLGGITIGSNGTHLIGLWFDGQKYFGATLEKDCKECDHLPVFQQTRLWLDTYFSGNEPNFTPPLFLRSTPFRCRVWEVLLQIPYGQPMTYGEISRLLHIGCAQAIGNAVGHNSISIIIPCHRVVATDGTLTGYAGGLDRKRWLLQTEQK